jgi:hypothetical protein
MGERYYVSGVQIGILIESIRHGDIKTYIKTMRKIIDEQYLGTVIDPKKQHVCITGGVRHG